MGIYANILGDEVKMDNLMAEATRIVLKKQGAPYLADSDGCVELTYEEVAMVLHAMTFIQVERGDDRSHFGAGKLMAWLQLIGDNSATLLFV